MIREDASLSCISRRVFNFDKLDPGDAFNHLPLTLKTLVKVELNCLSERYPIFSENLENMETANSVASEHLDKCFQPFAFALVAARVQRCWEHDTSI